MKYFKCENFNNKLYLYILVIFFHYSFDAQSLTGLAFIWYFRMLTGLTVKQRHFSSKEDEMRCIWKSVYTFIRDSR